MASFNSVGAAAEEALARRGDTGDVAVRFRPVAAKEDLITIV